jgi:hypothetical protein
MSNEYAGNRHDCHQAASATTAQHTATATASAAWTIEHPLQLTVVALERLLRPLFESQLFSVTSLKAE